MTAAPLPNRLSDMRTEATGLVATALSIGLLTGQDPPDPAQLLRDKLASPFLHHADWTTDYDLARRRAKERTQLVFGYFTTAGY